MQGFFQHSRQERGISSRLLVRFNLPKDRAQLGSILEKVSKIFIKDGFIKAIWQISHLSSATPESQEAQLYGHRAERPFNVLAVSIQLIITLPAADFSLTYRRVKISQKLLEAGG